jgi:hypothetical protein
VQAGQKLGAYPHLLIPALRVAHLYMGANKIRETQEARLGLGEPQLHQDLKPCLPGLECLGPPAHLPGTFQTSGPSYSLP